MALSCLRHLRTPVRIRFDGLVTTGPGTPAPEDEGTRFPDLPWDLRTLIIVFPPEAPFRFMHLGVLLGLTGVPYDQIARWRGTDVRDAVDLQFCLQGREHAAICKQYHSVARDLAYTPGAVRLRLGDRLRFEGCWPQYRIEYRQPDAGLEIDLRLDSRPGLQWWVRIPGAYCHYTSFAACRFEWSWRGESGALETPILHEHGWGRNLLPLRLPVRLFRYEILRLPADAQAISLRVEGPGGFNLRSGGVVRSGAGDRQVVNHYECEILEAETYPNYAGEPRTVPLRWKSRLESPVGRLACEATRTTEPRPVVGDGFMYAFDYRAEGSLLADGRATGEGYVEHFGNP